MEAWNVFLRALEKRFGPQPVRKWIIPLKVVQYDACNLYLEAENSFQIAWFEEHIRPIVTKEFVNNNGNQIKVHFQKNQKKRPKQPSFEPQVLEIKPDLIDPSMTFSNFIYHDPNRLTIDFFRQLIPGSFNPLFLYGDKGIGKTHLLHAIGNKFLAQGLSVFYVHAETFTQHVVEAIRCSQMGRFRKIYRNQDVLIVDDIEQFARRTATQEEFFHTFNALHTAEKQLILCSHLLPSRIDEIEPRLTSRFEWGIVMDLAPLPSEKMKLVLMNKARLHHFCLSGDVCQFLTESFSRSPKSMMRGLEALMIRHRSDQMLELEKARLLLKDLLEEEVDLQLTPEKLVMHTAAQFGIQKDDILGKSRSKECALPRKLSMYLCRKYLKLSYPAIGRFFSRDHSTVMNAIRQIETKSSSEEIEAALIEIEATIKS